MQFNKKVLLATAGVLAGTLAPAATTFAASGYDQAGNAGSGINLPVYTANSANAASGSAQAKSVATVFIKTGFLQLTAVPNLNFENSYAGGISKLKDNADYTGSDYNDGNNNNDGRLQVDDSRTSAASGATSGTTPLNGWYLQVALGDFKSTDASSTATVPSNWVLTINNKEGAVAANNAGTSPFVPKAGITVAQVTPTGADTRAVPTRLVSGAASGTTMWQAASGQGAGTTTGYFHSSHAASLNIPQDVADGSFYAPITWTLNAGVPSTSTPPTP
ncbi:MAG: WxL domain-containing protein [Lactobacillaceae bacterium]